MHGRLRIGFEASLAMSDPNSSLVIDGVVPVLPAPFTPDETVDLDSMAKLIQFSVDSGLSAVCLPAYSTEFYKLSMDERYALVQAAVEASNGRIPVIGQSNHVSAKLAAEIAAKNEELGVAAISVAIPRLFALSDDDHFAFLSKVIGATSLPVLVQDFNPGGPTVSPAFVKRLHDAHPNFRYLKLEEPLMAPKVEAILETTQGAVGVLEGWGGMFLLEGVSAGCCGVMPGLGLADLQQHIFRLAHSGDFEAAMDLFQEVLPHIVFSLQNLELFLHMDKQLLVRRNLLTHATVRSATLAPDPNTARHADFLTERVLRSVARFHAR